MVGPQRIFADVDQLQGANSRRSSVRHVAIGQVDAGAGATASAAAGASAKAALRTGHSHIVFEAFGSPIGFDFVALRGDVATEMGAEVALADGLKLVATLPRLDPRSPQGGVAPGLEGRLYRATQDGRELLETWSSGAIEVVVPGPGVYRVEVWMTPRQLAPYLGAVAANYTETPVPWIYSGAIFVR